MITLSFLPAGIPRPAPACYQIAGQTLVADGPLPELAAFARPGPAAMPAVAPAGGIPAGASPIFDQPAWVAGGERWVTCWAAPAGYRLAVAGLGSWFVSQDGGQIGGQPPPEADAGLVRQVALGPALILALALRGIYCLHASAVQLPQGVVVFVGESGQGKSTLAQYLAGQGERRIADDLLPVVATPAGVLARPHFPQLKFAPQQQPAAGLAAELPLVAVVRLADDTAEIKLARLPAQQAILTPVHHTAAARLFAPPLLARQLAFGRAVAGRVPVLRLDYPRRYEQLPAVWERVKGVGG